MSRITNTWIAENALIALKDLNNHTILRGAFSEQSGTYYAESMGPKLRGRKIVASSIAELVIKLGCTMSAAQIENFKLCIDEVKQLHYNRFNL